MADWSSASGEVLRFGNLGSIFGRSVFNLDYFDI